ncbi:hypothetical protein Lepto7375DRAFT_7429 [Leptolyngbya sp. PCC 7375]|nr:hypothetical protein Lepto7375DRAFT_7429 [Leptolyngbya sp. PCC 7375]
MIDAAMNKDALADWVRSELKGRSKRSLAKDLGFADTSVGAWLEKKVSSLKPEAVAAIAAYRSWDLRKTYKWLGLPMPKDASLGGQVDDLQSRMSNLEEQVAQLSQRVLEGALAPSPFQMHLQSELHLAGYDLIADKQAMQAFRQEAAAALGDPIAVQKVIALILGSISFKVLEDYTYAGKVLRRVLGPEWITVYLQEQEEIAMRKYNQLGHHQSGDGSS